MKKIMSGLFAISVVMLLIVGGVHFGKYINWKIFFEAKVEEKIKKMVKPEALVEKAP